jgi:hypothetical protein
MQLIGRLSDRSLSKSPPPHRAGMPVRHQPTSSREWGFAQSQKEWVGNACRGAFLEGLDLNPLFSTLAPGNDLFSEGKN